MRTSIGTALLAAALMSSVPAHAVRAETAAKKPQAAGASDLGARRHQRHDGYAYRPNYPYPMYYGRPVYYSPKPFLPIPPLWGYGWEWW